MAHINPCLKCVFIIFNLFFAIVGVAIIVLCVWLQFFSSFHEGQMKDSASGFTFFYIMGFVTMVISILGAIGACKEKKAFLVMFLVTMLTGSLLMLHRGVTAVASRPTLDNELTEKLREYRSLDTVASDLKELRHEMDILQSQMHCCGLFSYTDWKQNIPDSCLCDRQEVAGGTCTAVGNTYYGQQQKHVHSEPCFPIIRHYFLLGVDIVIIIIFTLAGLAVLGMALSSVMIHQLNRAFRPTTKPQFPVIFTAPPPKYEELPNPVKC